MSINKLDWVLRSTIPAVYDNSMSYYELLNAVMAKLNEVIDDTNTFMSEDLNEYVTTVLTGWKDDGTLDSIIEGSVFTDLNNSLNATKHAIGVSLEDYPMQTSEVTDDQRILRALNALSSGGVLVLPAGTYTLGQEVDIPFDNISIVGQGKSTLIKLADNLDLSNGGFYVSQKTGFKLIGVSFDGNSGKQQTTNHMVRLNNCDQPIIRDLSFMNVYGNCLTFSGSTNFVIDRIYATAVTGTSGDPGEVLYSQGAKQGSISNIFGVNISDHLIYLDQRDDGTPTSDIVIDKAIGVNCGSQAWTTGAAFNICNDAQRIKLNDCIALNSRCGFYFHENGVTGKTPSNYVLTNCTAWGSTFASGFYFAGVTSTPARTKTHGKAIGCQSFNNVGTTSSFGIRLENIIGFTLTDCDANLNGANGVAVRNSQNVQMNGGLVKNNGQTTASQGVRIGGDSTQVCQDCTIRGVDTGDDQASKTQTMGVSVLALNTNIKVIGGQHIGNSTNDVFLNDESVGEYIPDREGLKAAAIISVAANGSDGTLTIKSGSQYVQSVASSVNGIMITLKNVPSNVVPVIVPFDNSSTGFGTSGAQMGFIYTRSTSAASVELGLKSTASASHTPLNLCTVGSKGFAIYF